MNMIIGIDASRAFVDGRTGTEEYGYQVIKHLLRLPEIGAHILVLYVRPKAIIPDWAKVINVSIRQIKLRYLWTQVGLSLATWRDKLDILWIPAHTLPLLRRPELPTVVTIHGLEYKWLPEYDNWLQAWYLPLSTYYAARTASKIIAVSSSTKRDLIKETGINPEKVVVIHEGVEQVDRQKTRRTGKIKNQSAKTLEKWGLGNTNYLLFIGSLQPRKNLPVLIEAFHGFSKKYPGYRLVIVGGKGWKTREIFDAPSRWGVQEKVVFTGWVSEVEKKALLTSASIYVQPSWTEGFGLPVLEAMVRGLPVITTDGGALAEVAGGAAIVVKLKGKGLVNRLVRAMTRVADNRGVWQALSRKGQKRAETLNWDQASTATMSLFHRVVTMGNKDN